MKIKMSKSVWDKLSSQEKSFIVAYGDKYRLNQVNSMPYNCRLKAQSGKILKEFYGKTLDSMRTIENRAKRWQLKNLLEGETEREIF